ncbi:PHD-finger domain-containing protein [Besnoitia besnoiti]|uniref:PHD-finger domain-containing protein n=1 Tax=Besnoitia besnoiti TaxID=94643 RepID=A0A2A9MFL4_BESBE|nr:PHD-finger domain-containing protein [Besnoitia besnoiti]PFH35984.1 PHD-finger domain-containing protein [Besnoitia besnoiti]
METPQSSALSRQQPAAKRRLTKRQVTTEVFPDVVPLSRLHLDLACGACLGEFQDDQCSEGPYNDGTGGGSSVEASESTAETEPLLGGSSSSSSSYAPRVSHTGGTADAVVSPCASSVSPPSAAHTRSRSSARAEFSPLFPSASSHLLPLGLISGCRHVFHYFCIQKWGFTRENSCPQCKTRFTWLARYSRTGEREGVVPVRRLDQKRAQVDEENSEEITRIIENLFDLGGCPACGEAIRSDSDGGVLVCEAQSCGDRYHRLCCNISPGHENYSGPWVCPSCRESRHPCIDDEGRRIRRDQIMEDGFVEARRRRQGRARRLTSVPRAASSRGRRGRSAAPRRMQQLRDCSDADFSDAHSGRQADSAECSEAVSPHVSQDDVSPGRAVSSAHVAAEGCETRPCRGRQPNPQETHSCDEIVLSPDASSDEDDARPRGPAALGQGSRREASSAAQATRGSSAPPPEGSNNAENAHLRRRLNGRLDGQPAPGALASCRPKGDGAQWLREILSLGASAGVRERGSNRGTSPSPGVPELSRVSDRIPSPVSSSSSRGLPSGSPSERPESVPCAASSTPSSSSTQRPPSASVSEPPAARGADTLSSLSVSSGSETANPDDPQTISALGKHLASLLEVGWEQQSSCVRSAASSQRTVDLADPPQASGSPDPTNGSMGADASSDSGSAAVLDAVPRIHRHPPPRRRIPINTELITTGAFRPKRQVAFPGPSSVLLKRRRQFSSSASTGRRAWARQQCLPVSVSATVRAGTGTVDWSRTRSSHEVPIATYASVTRDAVSRPDSVSASMRHSCAPVERRPAGSQRVESAETSSCVPCALPTHSAHLSSSSALASRNGLFSIRRAVPSYSESASRDTSLVSRPVPVCGSLLVSSNGTDSSARDNRAPTAGRNTAPTFRKKPSAGGAADEKRIPRYLEFLWEHIKRAVSSDGKRPRWLKAI